MIDPTLVYLDTSFIVEAYESVTQMRVPVTITKTTDKSGNLSIGVLGGSVSAQETKEFPFSSRHMYDKIRKQLNDVPTVDLKTANLDSVPDLFWADGIFSVGSSEVSRKQEVIHRDKFFRLYPKEERKKGVYLLTKDIYFSSGYEQVLDHIHGATRGFALQARVLLKLMALQESGFWPLCAALIIEKTGNS